MMRKLSGLFCFGVFMLLSLMLIKPVSAQKSVDFSGAGGGGIVLGYDSRTCDGTSEGALRYNSSTSCAEFCDGTDWRCPGGQIGSKTVFATMLTYSADLGGVSGADGICSSRATTAGLTGTYYAWVASNSSNTPDARFNKSSEPYRLVDGTVIANSYADLISGSLVNAINRDEYGNAVASSDVWTNLNSNGTLYISADTSNCYGFTTNSGTFSARRGSTASTTGSWSSAGMDNCSAGNRIYCFQQ